MIDNLELNSKKFKQLSEGVLALIYVDKHRDFQCLTSNVYPLTLTYWKPILGTSNSGLPTISEVSVSCFLYFLALLGPQKALVFVLNKAWLLRTQFRDSSLLYDLDAC